MLDDSAYKELIKHHRTWVFGMPDSKFLIPLLKARLSPEDAEFFCKIPFIGHTAEKISQKSGIPIKELVEKLEKYAKKGLIYRTVSESEIRYNLSEIVFMYYRMPGWTGDDNEMMREVSSLSNKYYDDVFAKHWLKPHTRGLRTIPINETVEEGKKIVRTAVTSSIIRDMASGNGIDIVVVKVKGPAEKEFISINQS